MAAGARGLALAGMLLAFGTALLHATLLRRAGWNARPVMMAAAALALAGLAAWGLAEAAALADPANGVGTGTTLALLPRLAFGETLLAQMAAMLLAMTGAVFGRWVVTALATGAAVGLQAWHLHAVAMEPGFSPLLLSEVLHLLAAGAWLGALPALLLAIRGASIPEAARLARGFSPVGGTAVAILAATALWQGWVLVGGLPGLVGTAYGWLVLVKTALFALLLACATLNRLRYTPALAGVTPDTAKRSLVRSIGVETLLGLLVLAAAVLLTSQQPGMHLQPVWPFPVRPSLDIVRADDAFRQEVQDAVLALLGAVALVALGVIVRWAAWVRWLAFAAAAAIAWFAVPHFDLLFVEANPTSFYRSPTGFAATSIAAGEALYPRYCASCHGVGGRGDGPAAKGLPIPPADLTAPHLWGHDDGQMFWWLTHGIKSGEGVPVMPGFATVLSEEQRWALIDYVRARNAGLVAHVAGIWTPPVRAPGFEATCADGRSLALADLRGKVARIVFSAASAALGESRHGAETCGSDDPAIPDAYAVVTGETPAALVGSTVLVDANGWLRGVFPAGQEARMKATAGEIAASPLPDTAGAMHHHMMMGE